MDIEILGVVTGVLAVVCLLEIVLLILLGLFSYSLYKAAKQKTLTVFQLVDMIMSVNVYMTEHVRFLDAELVQNLSASQVPAYKELRSGLNDLKEFIRTYAVAADEIRARTAGD